VSKVMRAVGRRLARLDQRRGGHSVVLWVLPRVMRRRFDPVAAADLQTTLELAIRDPGGREPARFELEITDAGCAVRRAAADRPSAAVLVGADDLILLASGARAWPELVASGRFEISGDAFLALRFASLFRLPVRLEQL
jgi:SCP-2 sterol transfer family